MTKEIKLTKGQVALVDDWHYDDVSKYKWFASWNKHSRGYYAYRVVESKPKVKMELMHRRIMKTPDGMQCDHRDHNPLNNQEYNLRNVTQSQNLMNRRVHSHNKLGEKCIYRHNSGFRVDIWKDKKRVFTRTFRTLDEAIAVRNEKIREIHGEFSVY